MNPPLGIERGRGDTAAVTTGWGGLGILMVRCVAGGVGEDSYKPPIVSAIVAMPAAIVTIANVVMATANVVMAAVVETQQCWS